MLPVRSRGVFDIFEPLERRFDNWPDFFSFEDFKADMEETKTHYIITAELPGMQRENITINYERDILKIEGNLTIESEEKDKNFVRRERKEGFFSRSWLIKNIAEDNINAELKDGVLTVKLEKIEKTEKPKKTIEIK